MGLQKTSSGKGQISVFLTKAGRTMRKMALLSSIAASAGLAPAAAGQFYVSDQTRQDLGEITDYLPSWTSIDHLAVFSEQDFAQINLTDSDFLEKFNKVLSTITKMPGLKFNDQDARTFMSRSTEGGAWAYRFRIQNKGKNQAMCMVIAPPIQQGTDKIVSYFTSLPQDSLSKEAQDMDGIIAMSMAHEVHGHCNQPSLGELDQTIEIWEEFNADQAAMNKFYEEFDKGSIFHNPNLPAAWLGARAIVTLFYGHHMVEYAANFNVEADPGKAGEDALSYDNLMPQFTRIELSLKAIEHARDAVGVQLANRLGLRWESAPIHRLAQATAVQLRNWGGSRADADFQKARNELTDKFFNPKAEAISMDDFKKFAAYPGVADFYRSGLAREYLWRHGTPGKEEYRLMTEAVRDVYDARKFPTGSIEHRLLKQYLDGINHLAPTLRRPPNSVPQRSKLSRIMGL